MKRVALWITRLLAGFLILLVGAFFAVFEPVDHRPYFRTAYHSNTVARLDASLAKARSGTAGAPVRAGWGRVELTPRIGATADAPERGEFRAMSLAGYGARQGRPATGTHDPLWAKAIAVESGGARFVWVGLDALIIPREVGDAAAAELARDPGLSREQVYFGATHTHGSLGGWGEGFVPEAFAGPYQPGARVWMTRCLVDAARAAVSNLAPASVVTTSFRAPERVRNRLVGPFGRVDDEFSLVAFRRGDGARAVLGAFAAHATVLGADNMQFSGDYPGAWSAEVERGGVQLALFLAGAVGSHSPRAPEGKDGFERAAAMGVALARETERVLAGARYETEVRVGVAGGVVDLPEPQVRLADDLRFRPWAARRVMPVRSDTFVQAVRVGDAVWISMPCDYSGELALALKETGATVGRRVVVTSFNGDYIGYVIPGKYYHLGGYEPQTMSFFGPATGDYFDALARRLAVGM